ncbi:type II toxin-antitoxin system RelE/ParE family toxin [Bartonella bilalgolemii]|uniref:Type II toxin-antitoxin system RelE/ParE family toxin n=1 Tax=Bartonella bilalgolemii TaxID=2942911 RepID=A0ABT0PA95_9HYPH|nr:type II toxin-antitoxin system RelE/ParE family toxin [Bartonella sp. G70]MCL6230376.1 type II toxin-antitoxin system RelE/ParE family toxin [Bartonella sp. G70]
MNKIKRIIWLGSSLKDIKSLPDIIQQKIGYALYLAQIGDKGENVKILKGFGSANVLEIIERDIQGTYRAVYTIQYEKALYVLHCFQKKSTHGIATPKPDINLIKERLKLAEQLERN